MRRDRDGRCAGPTLGLAFGVAAGLAAPAAAAATPGGSVAVAWSTYLRAGPAYTAAAVDELEHDTRVAVLGCAERWCHVSLGSAQGYVDRDALELPRTRAPDPPARTDCVVVGQADNRGPIATRFCSGASSGAAAEAGGASGAKRAPDG